MKTYVWTIPMRIFHWLLVLGLITTYFLGEEDELLKFHVAFGYSIGILIIYRIIYGFIGSEYSRFSAFPISNIGEYFLNIKKMKSKYIGHNPFSALVMLLIFIVILMVVGTGILSLASMNQGIFKNIVSQQNDAFKELHEIFVNILITLVIIHLAGLVLDQYENKERQTIKSIFTGFKNVIGNNAKENVYYHIFLTAVIAIIIAVFTLTIKSDISVSEKSDDHQEEEFD